ncbi:hypothetical protein I4F81_010257 [Pyropia yezoensis]|uniref:Uncharacterized protein n=1 Tax=Pyropia yezoensis TaxID=2788 RepID=A0ACC3CC43_PYRYE|nr:hypothetical protein I4F81_010257 [Neopyropia yezoensis]
MPPPPAFLPSSLLAPPCVLTWRRPSPTVRTRRTPPTPSRSARLTPRAAAGGGAVISVSDLRLQAGTRDLVYIDRWALTAGNCVGIVGANGAGKSTLLRAIAGDDFKRAVQLGVGASLGYLPQQAVSGSVRSVWEEAGSEMGDLRAAEVRVAEAEATIDEAGGAERYEKAMQDFERAGGYDQDTRIARVLGGLGFTKDDWETRCAELSGGWQMRVALARLLLREPSVLLLDEPTNHLDSAAKAYLARYLREYRHTVVLVSHDVPLLDGCCSKIVEIADGQFAEYPGCNYSAYLKEKEMRAFSAANAASKTAAEAEKLESYITRFGAKATKAKSAKSKQKALDKLLREAAGSSPAPLDAEDRHTSKMRITLPPAPACARESVVLENADIGYDADAPLIRGVSLVLERGCRYGICGPNGVGKTTLLSVLAGKLAPLNADAVRRVGDERVSCGVFTQDLAADLPTHLSALKHLELIAPDETVERLRSVLGAMGVRGSAALRDMMYLSGGEQARVALASFVVQSHNVLLADEISNHLDVESVDTICDALVSFDGAVVIVSHDRRLIERVATHCIVVEHQTATVFDGVPKSALAMITPPTDGVATLDAEAVAPAADKSGVAGCVDKEVRVAAFKAQKEASRRASRAKKRLPAVEAEIEELERQLVGLGEEMAAAGADAGKALEVHNRVQAMEATIEGLYAEMVEMEAVLEESAAAANTE